MKNAYLASIVTIIAALGSGCAALEPAYDVTGEGLDRYCNEIPQSVRKENRAQINAKAADGRIFARCRGDQVTAEEILTTLSFE